MKVQMIIKVMFYAVMLGFFAWVIASWVDVMNNQQSGGALEAWNLFKLLFWS